MSFLMPSAPKLQPLPPTPTLSNAEIQAQQQQSATLAANAASNSNNIFTTSATNKPSQNIAYKTLLGD